MATVTTEAGQGERVVQGVPRAPKQPFGFGLVANTLLGYTLVKGLQLTLYNLIFPLYAYSLGYNQETIGRLNATGALMVLVASVPLGMLADRVGRARLLTISAFLSPLTLLGIALSSSLPLLVLWILAQNAVAVVYWSATSPLLIGAVPEARRVRVFSINSFFLWGIGALGSTIGGFVTVAAARALGVGQDNTAALRAALLFNAVLILVGALPLWRIRTVASAGDGAAGRAPLRLADLRLFGRLLVPDALQACGSGAIIGFLPLFFALRFGVEPATLGWLFTVTGVLGGVAALGAPTLVRRPRQHADDRRPDARDRGLHRADRRDAGPARGGPLRGVARRPARHDRPDLHPLCDRSRGPGTARHPRGDVQRHLCDRFLARAVGERLAPGPLRLRTRVRARRGLPTSSPPSRCSSSGGACRASIGGARRWGRRSERASQRRARGRRAASPALQRHGAEGAMTGDPDRPQLSRLPR